MHKIDPVDELAELRAEIARLETRAAKLRRVILSTPEAAQGRWHRAVVTQTRDNPLYWQERVTQVLKCVAVPAGPLPRPGWPIRREAGVGLH